MRHAYNNIGFILTREHIVDTISIQILTATLVRERLEIEFPQFFFGLP